MFDEKSVDAGACGAHGCIAAGRHDHSKLGKALVH